MGERKMKVLASILSILIGLTAIGGATLAWFTDNEKMDNEFTAGTVDIKVEEKVSHMEELEQVGIECDDDWNEKPTGFENWNPGDCYWKYFKITNKGSKRIYLRGEFRGQWYEKQNGEWVAWDLPDGVEDPVTVTVWQDNDWQVLDGYYFYKGKIQPKGKVYLKVKVCLDGPKAGNLFQGKRYVLTAEFEAIQTTNGAEQDHWGYSYDGSKWKVID